MEFDFYPVLPSAAGLFSFNVTFRNGGVFCLKAFRQLPDRIFLRTICDTVNLPSILRSGADVGPKAARDLVLCLDRVEQQWAGAIAWIGYWNRWPRRGGLVTMLLIFGAVGAISSALELPPPPSVLRPTPEPMSPPAWDVFLPPVDQAVPVWGVPAIAEWTRTGAPDDSLILTGDLLSNFAAPDEGKDSEFLVYGQTTVNDSIQAPALIQRLDGLKAAITLPTLLPAWSMYFIWPKNSNGYGSPVTINQTELWWLNPDDKVTRNERVSLYGRNLSHGGGTTASWIYVKPAGAAGQWVAPTSVNPYRVEFSVPASLSNGTYEVWVHNGHGGSYGWSGPLSLTVTDAYQWNGSIFDVRNYGATGDGVTDDADAINAANSAAGNYRDLTGLHPTLYFPAGTYLMRYGVGLEHDFRYLGDGRDLTIFRCHANFNQPVRQGDPIGGKLGLLIGNGGYLHDVEVRGLALDATSNFRDEGQDGWALNGGWDSGSDVHLSDLRIKVGNPGGCASTHQTKRLSVVGCEFVGGEFFLYRDYGVEIRNCTFLNANYQITSIHELTASNFSITDCRFQDLDLLSRAGRGQGRLLSGNTNQGAQYHAYVGDNVTVNLGSDPGDNGGEQIICEGTLNTFDGGSPTIAQPDSITFNDKLTTDYRRVAATAVITAGKGLGQYRLVTGSDGDRTITVSPNWNVTPDASSAVLIEAGTFQWAIYRNTFDGKSHYASDYTAMSAIQPAGGCYDWIGDNNIITNMRTALYVAAVQDFVSLKKRIHPCFFHLYSNNVIQSCYRGIYAGCGSTGNATLDPGTGFIGTIFRNNRLTDLSTVGVGETTFQTTGPTTAGCPLDMTLFEHNLFTNLPQGFDCDVAGPARVKNTILYKNVFQLGTAAFANSFGIKIAATTITPVLMQNIWIGFAATFSGTASSGEIAEAGKPVEAPKGIRVQLWNY